MQLSRLGVVITPPHKDGREAETLGRFAENFVRPLEGCQRGMKIVRENRCRERTAVYLREVMAHRTQTDVIADGWKIKDGN